MKQMHEIQRDFLREIHPRHRGFRPLRAALILAQAEEPRLDPEAADRILRSWEKRLTRLIEVETTPYNRIKAYNNFFYGELAFRQPPRGTASVAFIHPHHVIASRNGRGMALALLYQDLANRAGIPLRAIAFPGHPMFDSGWLGEGLFIDPIDGAILGVEDSKRRVERRLNRTDSRLRPQLLAKISARQFLERYMATLKGGYLAGHMYLEALRIAEWRLRLAPKSRIARWERGLILYELNRFEEAQRDFARVLPRVQVSQRSVHNVNRAVVCSLLANVERAFRST